MPKRSQGQQTGDLAVPRWQILLEPRYVFRPETPDFGIDGEVEEFDKNGCATGLRYKVQLKSTEEANLRRALCAHIGFSTANYWRAQDLPVLMVRYHKPTDRFYVRWFHTFDPYYGGVGKTGITFRWSEDDEWVSARADALAAEARAFLELGSNSLPLPFSIGVEVLDGAFGLTNTELMIAVRAAARRRPDVLRVLDRPASAGEGRLAVAVDRLAIDLGGVTTATLHLPGRQLPGHLGRVATDLLALTALAFERVGQADIAGRLAFSYLAKSDLLDHPEAPWALSSAMTRARQVREALTLADRIDENQSGSADDLSLGFTLPILFHSGSLSDEEQELAVGVLERRIDRRKARDDYVGAAQASVNLGNFFRAHAQPGRAVSLYEFALENDPNYGERAHYWHEKAGVRFGAQRYDEAADAYRRASELGSAGLTRALYADALMFAGRFAEAQASWQQFCGATPIPAQAAEYVLKLELVEEIVATFGITRQSRRTIPEHLAHTLQQAAGDQRSLAEEVLAYDALDANAWLLLAQSDLSDGDLAAYARHIRAVACLRERDLNAWVQAVILGSELPGPAGRLAEALVTGERLTDGGLLPALADFARSEIVPDKRSEWLGRFDTAFRSIAPDDEGGFKLRFLGDAGAVKEVVLPSAESVRGR
jgi:tetratricopeptide (TPR) repeat protein